MDLSEQTRLCWIKARASQGFSMCVELASHEDGVAIRHSRSPENGALIYSREEFAAFLAGAKAGEFDHFVDLPAPRAASSES